MRLRSSAASLTQPRRLRSFWRERKATSAIELALVLPLIAGMIVPLTDLGMGAYTKMQVQNAAQAGADYALKTGGFKLLDCQFLTEHLASLGTIEVGRDAYVALLDGALGLASGTAAPGEASPPADFFAIDRGAAPDEVAATVAGPISGWRIVQLLGQTS